MALVLFQLVTGIMYTYVVSTGYDLLNDKQKLDNCYDDLKAVSGTNDTASAWTICNNRRTDFNASKYNTLIVAGVVAIILSVLLYNKYRAIATCLAFAGGISLLYGIMCRWYDFSYTTRWIISVAIFGLLLYVAYKYMDGGHQLQTNRSGNY